jgi:hypothetical protein
VEGSDGRIISGSMKIVPEKGGSASRGSAQAQPRNSRKTHEKSNLPCRAVVGEIDLMDGS